MIIRNNEIRNNAPVSHLADKYGRKLLAQVAVHWSSSRQIWEEDSSTGSCFTGHLADKYGRNLLAQVAASLVLPEKYGSKLLAHEEALLVLSVKYGRS
jgi:hypothetical protein